MKSRLVKLSAGIVVLLMLVLALHAFAQPAPGGRPPAQGAQGFGGMGMGMGMMPGWPPAPTPVLAVADGVVYVACDGTLTAYEAKTLEVLGDAIYWQREEPPQ